MTTWLTPRRGLALLLALVATAACGIDERGQFEPAEDASTDPASGGAAGASDGAVDAAPDVADGEANDGDASDAADSSDATDALADSSADAPADAEDAAACGGVSVGGHCWYASAAEKSCTDACVAHGGCDLAGTRDFAGSGGSDKNCVAVLNALGYGAYSHQDWSNNDLGCQFAWQSWTYWSSAETTTCEAAGPGAAAVVRMCACNQ